MNKLHISINLNSAWYTFLESEICSSKFKELEQRVNEAYNLNLVYPAAENLFAAFNACKLEDVKVVILGQDPYHGPNQANGLAFSVENGLPIPPSLKNVYKELETDLNCTIPHSGNLTAWANQGVLLLNATLTVIANSPNSHSKIGWHYFTDSVIRKLSESKQHIVFILWGGFAQAKSALIDGSKHTILKAPHPSPLSVYRGFYGSKPFSKANKALVANGQREIKWSLV